MTTIAIIEARYASTRLPYKVLRPLAQKPMLHWVIKRAQKAALVDKVIVAMPHTPENAPVFAVATDAGAEVVTGLENDVLSRVVAASRAYAADIVVRLTGDNPFIDPNIIDECIWVLEHPTGETPSLVSTCRGETTWPRGYAVEVFVPYMFLKIKDRFDTPTKEHVTVPLYTDSQFTHHLIPCPWPAEWREKLRLTVDTYEDYHFASILYDRLSPFCRLGEVIAYCEEHPELLEINRHVQIKKVRG